VLDADNVIWSKDAPEPGSPNPVFYSSHLITSNMTNDGPSEFGPATGKKVRVITLAECACRDNVIYEEWLVRDYAAIVDQMGFDVSETAKGLAKTDVVDGLDIAANHVEKIAAIRSGKRFDAQSSDFLTRFFSAIYQNQDWDRLGEFYDFRVGARHPYGRDLYGPAQVQVSLETLLGAFSDVHVSIDHVAEIPYLGNATDVGVRWSLAGKHDETGEDM